ncbi:MAG TPA: CHAT domain-containing protein, partial [Pyrinomonadaceae bacterium]|nr:CHAT domain-containing protein [Pyrinomonadaceae bacterium]
ENELDKARLDYETFRADLYAAHPSLQAQRGEAKIITDQEISDLLLQKPNRVFLEYAVTDDATYLFVISKKKKTNSVSPVEINIHKIPISQKDLSLKTNSFRQAIANRDEYEKSGRELYNLLIAPAELSLKGKKEIVIVADSALWNLPFQALINQQNHFLLEDFVLSYAPSLTALREMQKISENHAAQPETQNYLLAFGNPTFETNQIEKQINTAILRGDETLLSLPEAEEEVKSLGNLYGKQRSKIYLKKEATEDRAKNESGKFKIIQFATHGVFNDANPLYSYLLLSPNTELGEDGMLEARELMNLNLSADLVVLSACETARGRVGTGEGLTGMTWALFNAGVPSTVASQWKVSSAGTTEIMRDFHRLLLDKTQSNDKAKALRQAELNFLRGKNYKHPYYWAGFILIGNN